MSRFIFLSFAFLGWAFYEVSGGPDFQPRISAAVAATEIPSESLLLAAPLPSHHPEPKLRELNHTGFIGEF